MSEPSVTVPSCPDCRKLMQESVRRNNEKGVLQSVQFTCACQISKGGPMRFLNVHLGCMK
jgi:hypothetical protein